MEKMEVVNLNNYYCHSIFIGLKGNIFVLIIVYKRNTRKTIHGIFVSCLLVADLFLLCFNSPFSILESFDIVYVSVTFNCRINLTVVASIGYYAGLFTTTSMAMHRC